MMRSKLSRRRSRRKFTITARRTHKRNMRRPMRGGIRL